MEGIERLISSVYEVCETGLAAMPRFAGCVRLRKQPAFGKSVYECERKR